MEVLTEPGNSTRAHVFIATSGQKLFNSASDLLRKSGLGAWLEERQFIQAIVVIVQDSIPRHFWVLPQP
jgi:hypothetical protein